MHIPLYPEGERGNDQLAPNARVMSSLEVLQELRIRWLPILQLCCLMAVVTSQNTSNVFAGDNVAAVSAHSSMAEIEISFLQTHNRIS